MRMTSLILAVSVLAFGAIACDEGGEGGTPDAGDPTHNN